MSKIKIIKTSQGTDIFVDEGDFERLSKYNWSDTSGYATRSEKGKTVYMHKQIMSSPKGMHIDHIDRNRRNNSRSNLRVCTRHQNQSNRTK